MKNSLLRWLQWSTSCGKLRSKLLCIYFLLIVIPLGMFSLYAYLRVKSVIQEQTFSAAQNAFDDTCLSLEHLLGRLDGVIDILSTDSLIYTMASNDRVTLHISAVWRIPTSLPPPSSTCVCCPVWTASGFMSETITPTPTPGQISSRSAG